MSSHFFDMQTYGWMVLLACVGVWWLYPHVLVQLDGVSRRRALATALHPDRIAAEQAEVVRIRAQQLALWRETSSQRAKEIAEAQKKGEEELLEHSRFNPLAPQSDSSVMRFTSSRSTQARKGG